MYHFYDVVINEKTGVPLSNVIIRIYDDAGVIVPLFADENGSTPIEAVSGLANAAVTDNGGNYDFYVADGTYDIRFFVGDAVLKVLANILMGFPNVDGKAQAAAIGVTGSAVNMGTFTGTIIPDNQTAKQGMQSLETSLEGLSLNTGAARIGTIAAGSGGVDRTQQAHNSDLATAEDRGAVGNGSADDSAAFAAGLTVKRNLSAAPGKSYPVKDVALSHSQSIAGNGAIFSAVTGASNMFALADTDPRISDLRIASNLNATGAAFRIAKSRAARLDKITAVNTGYGLINLSPDNAATDAIALPFITGIQAEQVSGVGVNIGQNVSEMRGGDLHFHGNLVAGTGGLKPQAGTIGWRQNQPLSGGIARGGHQMSKMNMIAFETGWYFTDVELLMYDNIYADSCSGFGMLFDGSGNADGIQLSGTFIGTSRGYLGAGNSNVAINGLTTIYNGQIFSWMASDFYTGAAYDVTLQDTAKLTISGYWRGEKKLNIASTAKLIINCGIKYNGRTTGTIAANSTGYLAEFGVTGTEGDATWRAPCAGRVVGITTYNVTAPGVAESFTYTLRKNFADTAFVATASGAAAFGGDNWSPTGGIAYAAGDSIAVKLVTSLTAAPSRHTTILHFVPD